MADNSSLHQPPQVTEAMIDAAFRDSGVLVISRDEIRRIVRAALSLGAPETPPPLERKYSADDVEIARLVSGLQSAAMEHGADRDMRPVVACEACADTRRTLFAAIDAFAARAPSSPPPPQEEVMTTSNPVEVSAALKAAAVELAALPPSVPMNGEAQLPSGDVRELERARIVLWLMNRALSPPPPATPSAEAIEAALRAAPIYADDQVSNAARVTAESVIRSPNTLAYQIRLSIREWLDENGDGGLLAILRAAYAVDFGAQSRPEAKHPEGR